MFSPSKTRRRQGLVLVGLTLFGVSSVSTASNNIFEANHEEDPLVVQVSTDNTDVTVGFLDGLLQEVEGTNTTTTNVTEAPGQQPEQGGGSNNTNETLPPPPVGGNDSATPAPTDTSLATDAPSNGIPAEESADNTTTTQAPSGGTSSNATTTEETQSPTTPTGSNTTTAPASTPGPTTFAPTFPGATFAPTTLLPTPGPTTFAPTTPGATYAPTEGPVSLAPSTSSPDATTASPTADDGMLLDACAVQLKAMETCVRANGCEQCLTNDNNPGGGPEAASFALNDEAADNVTAVFEQLNDFIDTTCSVFKDAACRAQECCNAQCDPEFSSVYACYSLQLQDTTVELLAQSQNLTTEEKEALFPEIATCDLSGLQCDEGNQNQTTPPSPSSNTTTVTITSAFVLRVVDPGVWNNPETSDVLQQATQALVEDLPLRKRWLRTTERRLASVDPESVAVYDVQPVECSSATLAPQRRGLQQEAENATTTTAEGEEPSNSTTTATPDFPDCVKVSVRYDVVLEEGDDPAQVQSQYQTATNNAIASGALQESIAIVAPSPEVAASMEVVGAAEPEPLPSTSTVPPTSSGSGNATAPPTTEKEEEEEKEEDNDSTDNKDDGGGGTNWLAIILGIVFGLIGCVLLMVVGVMGGGIWVACAAVCCCCKVTKAATNAVTGGGDDEDGGDKDKEKGDEESPEEEEVPAANKTFDQDQDEDEEEASENIHLTTSAMDVEENSQGEGEGEEEQPESGHGEDESFESENEKVAEEESFESESENEEAGQAGEDPEDTFIEDEPLVEEPNGRPAMGDASEDTFDADEESAPSEPEDQFGDEEEGVAEDASDGEEGEAVPPATEEDKNDLPVGLTDLDE